MSNRAHGDARIDDLFVIDASRMAESIAERTEQERRRKQTVPITAAWKRLKTEMPETGQFNPRFTTEKETHMEIAKAANLVNDLAAAIEATRLPILERIPPSDATDEQAFAILRRAMMTPGSTVKLLIDAYKLDRCSSITAALKGRLEHKAGEAVNRFVYTGEWTAPTPVAGPPAPEAIPPSIQTVNTPPGCSDGLARIE